MGVHPDRYREAIDLLSAGQFWEACLALDAIWWEAQDDLHQGLILLSAGFYHAGRGNASGCRKALHLAIAYLTSCDAGDWDVPDLVAAARACLGARAGEPVAFPRRALRRRVLPAAA